ncbi:MAG: hypothetical protein MSG64_19690 [Pyrinomonadaceae bacterium MAG19_C2-C3]|nr:hypothetical protein [Pyrinomonadaceae bacterium MAG19_C2-C3]
MKTIGISVLGDATPEQDEIFNVTLSSATGATLVRSQGQATILDAGGKGRRGTRSRRRRV